MTQVNDGRLDISWTSELDDIHSLSASWTKLHQRVKQRTVHSSFDWVYPWYRHLADKDTKICGTPLLGVARFDGDLVGIAPLVIYDTKISRVPVHCVGHAGYNSEAGEFLILDSMPELLPRFIESLTSIEHFDVARLNGLFPDSAVLLSLSDIHPSHKLSVKTLEYRYAFVDLRDGYDAYYKSRSSRYRRILRKQENTLQDEYGQWEVITALEKQDSHSITSNLGRMTAIYNASWKSKNGRVLPSHYEDFYSDVAHRAAAHDTFFMGILTLGGRDAAYFYALLDRGKLYDVFISYDDSFKNSRPGEFLMLQLLKILPSIGAHELVSHGDHPYKSVWSTGRTPVTRAYLFAPTLHGRVCLLSYSGTRLFRSIRQRLNKRLGRGNSDKYE